MCHSETLENKSDQKKSASCTFIRLKYNITKEPTAKVLKDVNLGPNTSVSSRKQYFRYHQ